MIRYRVAYGMVSDRRQRQVKFGQTVYDGDGNELGRVRNLDDGGFYVTNQEGVSTSEQAQSKAGEKTLMWRCDECGEVGARGRRRPCRGTDGRLQFALDAEPALLDRRDVRLPSDQRHVVFASQ